MCRTERPMMLGIVVLVAAISACGTSATTTSTIAETTATTAPTTAIPTTSASPTTTAGEETTTTAGATSTSTPGPTVIEVSVAGGEVAGPGQVEVSLGSDVVLRVTSDVADEVHLHGYDVFADVAAGGTVELSFTADREGIFEVELEDARLPLLEIIVR